MHDKQEDIKTVVLPDSLRVAMKKAPARGGRQPVPQGAVKNSAHRRPEQK